MDMFRLSCKDVGFAKLIDWFANSATSSTLHLSRLSSTQATGWAAEKRCLLCKLLRSTPSPLHLLDGFYLVKLSLTPRELFLFKAAEF